MAHRKTSLQKSRVEKFSKLLDHALHHPTQLLKSPLKLELVQKLAFNTYNEPDLSPESWVFENIHFGSGGMLPITSHQG